MFVANSWLGLPRVNSQSGLHWASGNSSVTVQIFIPRHRFSWQFLHVSLCFDKLWLPVFSFSPTFGTAVWPGPSPLLQILEDMLIFQSVHNLIVRIYGVLTSKLLIWGTGSYFHLFLTVADFMTVTWSNIQMMIGSCYLYDTRGIS